LNDFFKNHDYLPGKDEDLSLPEFSRILQSSSPILNSPVIVRSPTRILKTLEIIVEPIELPSYILLSDSSSNSPDTSLEPDCNSSLGLVSLKSRRKDVSLNKVAEDKFDHKKTARTSCIPKDDTTVDKQMPITPAANNDVHTTTTTTTTTTTRVLRSLSKTKKENSEGNFFNNSFQTSRGLNHRRNHCWYMRVPSPAYSAANITFSQLLRQSQKLRKNRFTKTFERKLSSLKISTPNKTNTSSMKYSKMFVQRQATLNLIGRLRQRLKGKLKGKLSISKPNTTMRTPRKSVPMKVKNEDETSLYKTPGREQERLLLKDTPGGDDPGKEAMEVVSKYSKKNGMLIVEPHFAFTEEEKFVKKALVKPCTLSTSTKISPYFNPNTVKSKGNIDSFDIAPFKKSKCIKIL